MTLLEKTPEKSKKGNKNLAHYYHVKKSSDGYHWSYCGSRRLKNIDGPPNYIDPLCVVCEDLRKVFIKNRKRKGND